MADQRTIKTYNLCALDYDAETSGFWDEFPRGFIDQFAGLSSGTVLDIGCGPGRDGMLLQEAGLKVVCLDASMSMLSLCQAKNMLAVVGDFVDLPFKSAGFGAVWSYTSLLHVPKWQIGLAFAEAARVIQPGGTFGLGLIEGHGQGYRISSGMSRPRWFSYYTKAELDNLLAIHGFESLHTELFQPASKRYLHILARKLH